MKISVRRIQRKCCALRSWERREFRDRKVGYEEHLDRCWASDGLQGEGVGRGTQTDAGLGVRVLGGERKQTLGLV